MEEPSASDRRLKGQSSFSFIETGHHRMSVAAASPNIDNGGDPIIQQQQTAANLRRAAADLLDLGEKRSRRSIVDVRPDELEPLLLSSPPQRYLRKSVSLDQSSVGNTDDARHDEQNGSGAHSHGTNGSRGNINHFDGDQISTGGVSSIHSSPYIGSSMSGRRSSIAMMMKESENLYIRALGQVPAVLLVALLNLMIGIPFGVSYFPVGWKPASDDNDGGGDDDDTDDNVHGVFPLPGKEALGIRMFLFATIIGQVVFAFMSKFKSAISLQMVENVPFCHALAYIVIAEQGFGVEALSTLFFLFGLASVIVGITFYLLGRLELGRVVYFFPSHVLVGCIGGIGVFIIMTGIEVTLNEKFTLSMQALRDLWDNMNLFGVVLFFEFSLRLLDCLNHDKHGKARLPLLAPIFFCLITPMFYLGVWLFGCTLQEAVNAGYFFPSTGDDTGGVAELFQIFTMVDIRTISWTAVFKAIPTLVALASFSLIHVPINLPAFGISTNTECDMNAELIAHGYSNFCSGLVAGLQNYMTYSNSVLYAKSGGEGPISSLIVALLTTILFFVGPSIATYIPRCMAGTLLCHIGIDLFLEGVYDSIGDFDWLEYTGIWVITIVMTVYGMSSALIAGIIAALSTYAVQSITHHNPIRGHMSAATLRSSLWNRSPEALAILESTSKGRIHILVLQLQGHLFFGNVAQVTDSLKEMLEERRGTPEEAWIVLMDFSLVIGMDSSAAHAVAKLQGIMHQSFDVEVTIFVTGSGEGFPCEYALTQELSKMKEAEDDTASAGVEWETIAGEGASTNASESNASGTNRQGSSIVSVAANSPSLEAGLKMAKDHHYPTTKKVCQDLDSALMFAEDILIARADPVLFHRDQIMTSNFDPHHEIDYDQHLQLSSSSLEEEERAMALTYLTNLCPGASEADVDTLFSYFQRERYVMDDIIWKQGSKGNCAKLLVRGMFISYLENADGEYETIKQGNILGELALTKGGGRGGVGMNRLTTVMCATDDAIAYTLEMEAWERLVQANPRVARLLDGITIRYLTHRVQHVSNRVWATHCLPI